MKKILLLLIFSIYIITDAAAQVPKVPKKIPKIPLPTAPTYIIQASRTTTNYKSRTQVNAWMENIEGKGQTLKFTATAAIMKVTVKPTGEGAQITNYGEAGAASGYFYLESPAYGKKESYLINFYEVGHPDKAIWTTLVTYK